MKYTKVKSTTAQELQLNAGIFVDSFTPSSATMGNILYATSGGCNFSDKPEFTDFGEDIDNMPKNTMEMKKITGREVKMSGTALTVTPAVVKSFMGAADIDSSDTTHIVPRDELLESDFDDIWWIGDYSDKNGATNGGFVAIHLMNALSTDGFQLQTTEKGKGQFAFGFTGHYSLDDPTEVPYEIYVKAGTSEPA